MQSHFLADPEPLLGTLAKLFAAEGLAKHVAILTYSTPEVVESGYDNWDGGITQYTLYLHVPLKLFPQLADGLDVLEYAICNRAQIFLEQFRGNALVQVKIMPTVEADAQWREKASSWLSGKVSNQGRVRSDNVAPLSVDGLLFRSNPEVHLYRALKAAGISFAPLPVFVRGGEEYRRIEPDFLLVHAGVVMIVEVDGDTVHQETPAEAHSRTTMLMHEGVHIERIKSSECDNADKAKLATNRIVKAIEKHKLAR